MPIPKYCLLFYFQGITDLYQFNYSVLVFVQQMRGLLVTPRI